MRPTMQPKNLPLNKAKTDSTQDTQAFEFIGVSYRRLCLAMLIGGVAAATTIYLMQVAISQPKAIASRDYDYNVVDFVRLKRDDTVDAINRSLPKKPEPPTERLTKPTAVAPDTQVNPNDLNFDLPSLKLSTNITGGPKLGGLSTHATTTRINAVAPLVRIQPRYPTRAAIAGVEGEVLVGFTVTPTGAVKDVEIISASPKGYFEQEAKRTLKKWKFNPKIVDGNPVAFSSKQKLVFKLNK